VPARCAPGLQSEASEQLEALQAQAGELQARLKAEAEAHGAAVARARRRCVEVEALSAWERQCIRAEVGAAVREAEVGSGLVNYDSQAHTQLHFMRATRLRRAPSPLVPQAQKSMKKLRLKEAALEEKIEAARAGYQRRLAALEARAAAAEIAASGGVAIARAAPPPSLGQGGGSSGDSSGDSRAQADQEAWAREQDEARRQLLKADRRTAELRRQLGLAQWRAQQLRRGCAWAQEREQADPATSRGADVFSEPDAACPETGLRGAADSAGSGCNSEQRLRAELAAARGALALLEPSHAQLLQRLAAAAEAQRRAAAASEEEAAAGEAARWGARVERMEQVGLDGSAGGRGSYSDAAPGWASRAAGRVGCPPACLAPPPPTCLPCCAAPESLKPCFLFPAGCATLCTLGPALSF
jgi:hypothetical protein